MRKLLAAMVVLWASIAYATVPNEVTTASLTCNGQTTFPFSFKTIKNTDVKVTVTAAGSTTAALLTLGSDYSVTGVGSSTGGSVVLVNANRCAPSSTLKISRVVDLKQTTSFRDQGTYRPAVHENAFDKLAMGLQQLSEKIGTVGSGAVLTNDPVFSVLPGAVTEGTTTYITSSTSGAQIYTCPLAGCTPVTPCGTTSGGCQVVLHPPVTVRAAASAAGKLPSATVEASYTLYNPEVPDTTAPTITRFNIPDQQLVNSSSVIPVGLLAASDNVGVTSFMFTQSSATPSASDPGWLGLPSGQTNADNLDGYYTIQAPTVMGSYTYYVWAKDEAGNVSASRSDTILIMTNQVPAPTISPASGTVSYNVLATISDSDPLASIYYCMTDATCAPTTLYDSVNAPIHITQTTALRALARRAGYVDSLITTNTYSTSQPQVSLAVTPAPGAVSTSTTTVTAFPTPASATITYCTTTIGGTCSPSTAWDPSGLVVTPPIRVMLRGTATGYLSVTYTLDYSVAVAGQCDGSALPATPVMYICNCDTGADANCVNGNDANTGNVASAPKRTLSAITDSMRTIGTTLGSTQRTVALCRGGLWAGAPANSDILSSVCTAANPCTLRDYIPSWGTTSTARPRINHTGGSTMFNLDASSNGVARAGYRIWNLDVRQTPINISTGDLIFIYGPINDVDICNVRLEGTYLGINAQPSTGQNMSVRQSQFYRFGFSGYYGGGPGTVIERSYFENCGLNATEQMHSVYMFASGLAPVGGIYPAVTMRASDNHFVHGTDPTYGRYCRGTALVIHGAHNGTVVWNNLFEIDGSPGCYAYDVSSSYVTASLTGVKFEGNRIVMTNDADATAIHYTNCSGCSASGNYIEMLNSGTAISASSGGSNAATVNENHKYDQNTIYMKGGGQPVAIIDGSVASYTGNVVWNNGGSCFSSSVPVTKNLYNYCSGSGQAAAALFNAPASGDMRPLNPGPLVGGIPVITGLAAGALTQTWAMLTPPAAYGASRGGTAPYDIGAFLAADTAGPPAPPGAPTITSPTAGGGGTINSTITLTGTTTQPGGTVVLWDDVPTLGATNLGTCTLVAQAFTCAASTPYTSYSGTHSFTVKQTDTYSQTSAASNVVTITLSAGDTTVPTISTFSLPATSSNLTVALTWTASDNVAVTGYYVSQSTTAPTLSAYVATKPASFTFPGNGVQNLYGWVRDAAGNVSTRSDASTTVTVSANSNLITDLVDVRQMFSQRTGLHYAQQPTYNGTSTVITLNYGSGPTGAVGQATRWLTNANVYPTLIFHTYLTASTTYTASWYVRETSAGSGGSDGLTYQVADWDLPGTLLANTTYPALTTSWTRVCATFATSSGGGGGFEIHILDDTSGTSHDLEFYGFKIETGTECTGAASDL